MRQFVRLWLLLCVHPSLYAQQFTTPTDDGGPGDLLTVFDQTPVFPGDVPALFQYFEQMVMAPMSAREQQATDIEIAAQPYYEQQVVLAFDLNRYGEIDRRRVVYSSNLLMDRSWQKAIENMPLWAPAICYGVPTDVQVYLPLRYIIQGNQIVILGWGEWVYESSGKETWIKWGLIALAAGIFAFVFFR